MSDYDMKDSGQREEFTTGAVRDSREGKGRYDLIPVIALKRVAAVYEKGASKYTPRNWEAGLNQSRCYDSALRHLMQYAEGLRDEDHLAQAAFNVLAMIFTEEQVNRGNLPASLMDLPSYVKDPVKLDPLPSPWLGGNRYCPNNGTHRSHVWKFHGSRLEYDCPGREETF